MSPIKQIPFFIYFVLILLPVHGNNINRVGVPYIQNYPKALYGSGNQNWSVVKDKKGIMYFGNAEGLLAFDGKYWQLYQMPNRQIVRAVATDEKGNIYTGGFAEFGIWSVSDNKLRYKSLTHLIPKGHKIDNEIWKIYTDGDKVIFQSFSTIYIYQNNSIQVIKADHPFLFLHKVGKRFFVEVLSKGLFELVNNKLINVKNSFESGAREILSILPYKNNSLLIGTSRNGLIIYDGINFNPLNSPANSFLKTFHLNNGARVLGKFYAYGSILNGIIIIDENGNIVQKINKSAGLQNNTVLSLYADDQENLWAGLDNGIDRIELNSPLHFYFDKAGQFGTVYSSLVFDNKIYLGTNQGLFYSDWSNKNGELLNTFNFNLIPNSQGQVWDLTEIDGQLFVGHNEGAFQVEGNQIEKISSVNGGWTIKKLNSNPNMLIQGTYTGLVIYARQGDKYVFRHKIIGFDEPSRYVEQDANGDIWVSHAYRGLYKLTLSPDFKRVLHSEYYDKKEGLPGTYNINVFKIENRIVFSSDSGFYTHDDMSGKFWKYNSLNNKLGSFRRANKIISAGQKKYWFINHGKTALVNFSDIARPLIDSNTFSMLDGRMVQYYENISRINNDIYLISVDDGFVVYYTSNNTSNIKGNIPKILLRKVEDITDKLKVLSEFGSQNDEVNLPYSRNNIRISFAIPYYRQARVSYQYFLEGYSKEWSQWSPESQKDFTNLGTGDYVFKVRAKIDDALSETVSFKFSVLTPWYAGLPANIVYVLILIGILILAKRGYDTKLKRDRRKIQEKFQAEQEERLKKEADVLEKQILALQTEKLQDELATKGRELSNSAMSLVYKNELLQNLSGVIAKLKDDHGNRLAEEQIKKIQKVINDGLNDEKDWDLFEHSFNEAHESFFRKLKVKHPALVPNDLKLCAYLRMNMSSKEIASLLNITLRGVEIRRYRLRKKLQVEHDKNLTEFLMEL
jgi:ligand-binding sensor domain-containing protein/DNA-binding CsgD family transcriptional regulator